MARSLLGAGLMLLAMAAAAEERFYPVIGPDGSVQMIRSPGRSDPAAGSPRVESQAATARQGEEHAEPGATAATPMAPEAAAPAYAPYDSEEYLDSERFEAATKPKEGGKRFYLINDGMGRHVDQPERDAAQEDPVVPAPVPTKAEAFVALASSRRDAGPGALSLAAPGLPACLDEKARGDVAVLDYEGAQGLVVDEAAWRFLPPTRVLATYGLVGQGPRTLRVRSFARKDKQPSFLHPRLALLGEDGCVTRVLQGVFDRLYKATDKRHAMLQGDVVVHAEEAFVVVVAPEDVASGDAALPFREARHGQLKFTLMK